MMTQPAVCTYSIHTESFKEAEVYKWIESERAGRDLGEEAIKRWVRDHWWGYLRARWIEHLQGQRFWIELDRNDFGLLLREFPCRQDLLNDILAFIKDRKENLDIVNWALCNDKPIDQVLDILIALDINSRRLSCKFGCSEAQAA